MNTTRRHRFGKVYGSLLELVAQVLGVLTEVFQVHADQVEEASQATRREGFNTFAM